MSLLNKETLYDTKDVTRIRTKLLEAQGGKCKITGIPIAATDAVLDHDHSNSLVRAVLHRQSNAVLGKIENLWNRYLSWWYPNTLADFLRQVAKYLDTKHPQRYYHPGWKKKVTTSFNKLNAGMQLALLSNLLEKCNTGVSDIPASPTNNLTARRKLFSKLILNRQLNYDIIVNAMQHTKEQNEVT